jgi:hypothetical protein
MSGSFCESTEEWIIRQAQGLLPEERAVFIEYAFMPPGTLNFPTQSIWRVAVIYAALLGRTLDTNAALGGRLGWVSFKNQTTLSREEASYALETLFAWQGFKLIPVDKNLARLVPIADSDSHR